MSDSIPYVQRPEIITRLLNIKNDIKVQDERDFYDFLGEVEMSYQTANEIHNICQVSLSYQVVSVEVSRAAENSSLRTAFDFYAKLQTPGQQLATSNVTYELVRFANETLSFHELAVWMRDFNVIPSLLTKGELRFLWKITSLQWVRMGKDQIKYLTFDMFQDFFARMAVLAYNKPGMRRLILNTNGLMPSPADLVETLCHFMHLDDFGWVKDRLNTVGRESVRNHNFRTVGEKNETLRGELREDVKGSRFSRMMTNADNHNDRQEGASAKEKEATGNEGLKSANRIAEALQQRITGLVGDGDDVKDVDIEDDDGEDTTPEKEMGGRLRQKTSTFSSSIRISPEQEEALLNYDENLSKLLDKYSLAQTSLAGQSPDARSGGAFLDMGDQQLGRVLVINVSILNTSTHEMQVDVIARGFPDEDTRVTMLARSFAPGLKRDASVQFTVKNVPKDRGAVVAYIDVHAVPVRGTASCQPVLQRCPVHYRPFMSAPPVVALPLVNVNNMPIVLERYRSEDAPRTLATSFEKQRDWYQGVRWRQGPSVRGPEGVCGVTYPPSTFPGSASPTKLLVATKRKTKKDTLPLLRSPKKAPMKVELPGMSRGLVQSYEIEEV